jgi:XTP/dITP diphosphohydrolase
MLPTTLILATGNPHKVSELRAIFAAAHVHVLGLTDLPFHAHLREPEEHGTTFEENARIKALSYATQIAAARLDASMPHASVPASFLTLADDSGLEIDALQGRPGIVSSHYSTDGIEAGMSRPERDAANNARVLRELEGVPTDKRTARFVCCMCLVGIGIRDSRFGSREEHSRASSPSVLSTRSSALSLLHTTRGTFEGRIGHPHIPPRVPAGNNGFGYDPLFLVAPDFTRTGAELTSEEKNTRSHRGAAARAIAEWLREYATRP